MKGTIFIQKDWKHLRSETTNYSFNMKDGTMHTWGRTDKDDPSFSPFGPFILDVEITTICKHGCSFCYKSNNANGKNMSFDTFKVILDKMPATLTQIAFGVDAYAESNPDLFKMMEYTRSKKIIPNLTVAKITDEVADKIASLAGACAVSRYSNKNDCYDSVKKLTSRGMKQVNIHNMICEETYDQTIETINDMASDPRLNGMYALVMLSLKKKGRGKTGFTPLSQERFNSLCDHARVNKINYGFDSCGSSKYIKYLNQCDLPEVEKVEQRNCIEPCESTAFSAYINVDGIYTPCSFCDGEPKWEKGIDVTKVQDFVKEVWYHPTVIDFRTRLLSCKRDCPMFDI